MCASTRPEFSQLNQNQRADVCIVGAGVSGLTTAYLLTKAGKSVIVLDDGPILSGETERTTAHLVTVLDKRYCELEQLHGEGGARLAAESHAVGIDTIERIIRDEHIDCNFERVDGYLFNDQNQPPDLLDRELAAARRAGLVSTEMVDRAPTVSFNTGRALRFRRQAQFHPTKYLAAVARAIVRDGGRIYTDTHVTKIHGGESAHVETQHNHTVSCEAIVMATHTPINNWLIIHAKQTAYRSYIIGVIIPTETVPKALYWDTGDPYHYIRKTELTRIFHTMDEGMTIWPVFRRDRSVRARMSGSRHRWPPVNGYCWCREHAQRCFCVLSGMAPPRGWFFQTMGRAWTWASAGQQA
jgi:glycine/D-amino acid oxidase-like deaminating enzyme